MSGNKGKILWYIIPLLMVGGTAVLLHSHLRKIEDQPPMELSPWALRTDVVQVGVVDRGFPALGKVESSTEVRIVPQISGTVLKMGPREGGKVKKGEPIVILDTRGLEADAAAVKAKLASAEAVESNDSKELERERSLLEEGGSSASAVEQFQTRVRSDRANMRSLKKQLESLQIKISYGRLLSPVTGRISKRLAEPGDSVFPGKPVYVLTANRGGRVIVPVPLDTVTHAKVGGKTQLSWGGKQLTARITRINPSLDALSMGNLEIDLPERPFNLPDGAPVSARVITAVAGPGLSIPLDALRPAEPDAQRVLFKVIHGKTPQVQLTPIKVRLCGKDRCIVEGNLEGGDRVVTAHGSVLLQLHDGDRILNDWEPSTPVRP